MLFSPMMGIYILEMSSKVGNLCSNTQTFGKKLSNLLKKYMGWHKRMNNKSLSKMRYRKKNKQILKNK